MKTKIPNNTTATAVMPPEPKTERKIVVKLGGDGWSVLKRFARAAETNQGAPYLGSSVENKAKSRLLALGLLETAASQTPQQAEKSFKAAKAAALMVLAHAFNLKTAKNAQELHDLHSKLKSAGHDLDQHLYSLRGQVIRISEAGKQFIAEAKVEIRL